MPDNSIALVDETEQIHTSDPECGICMDAFQLVHSPVNAARYHRVASSTKKPFGLSIPCPGSHQYCQGCLASYIKLKIDPDGDGSGNPNMVVFPIRCPECSITDWEVGITDDIASRVLSEKDMLAWVSLIHSYSLILESEQHTYYSITKNCLIAFLVYTVPTSSAQPLSRLMRIWMNHKPNVRCVTS